MSLMRAFTNRRTKTESVDIFSPNQLGRAASQRGGKPVLRFQISSPVALVSTTNMLSYQAPDIPGAFPTDDAGLSSSSSEDESDASTMNIDTSGHLTDASSIDNSPTSPEPNHLSCYFKPAVDTSSISRSASVRSRASCDAPAIPQRVRSHSKKAHEHVHRKRSVQRMMSPPASIRSSTGIFSSSHSSFVETPKESIFGSELAQLDEVVEEPQMQAVCEAETDPDVVFMHEHSLASYNASDYLCEIQDLVDAVFLSDDPSWI